MNERRSLTAQVEAARVTQERLATTLAEVRRSKRYRLGQTLAVSWWLLLHPAYVAARAREETWQWARTILPLPAKRWIKRSVLRRPQAPWSGPAAAPSGRPAVSQAPGAMPALQPGAPHLEPMARAPKRTPSDLIVFSIIDWHFRFQRSQQLSCQFADHGHRVFYVSITFEEPGSPAAAGLSPRLTPIRPHVHEIHLRAPASLSVYRDRLTPELADLWADAFDRLRAEQDVVDAVCLVQLPFWRPIALRLRERFGWTLVYDCMDRHSGFSTNDPAMLDEEEALTRDSDLVIATARLLYDEHRALNPRCVLVPNATDYAHFSAFVGEPPDWLQRLRRPIIGYYGAIADWFDTVLVGTLARLRPEWSFVLVGSTFTADLRPLEGLPNVHLPGEQPYSRLPAFLHSFDVCLIPFKRLPLTDATNPVKFYEYLSAGKPVVAVSLPELSPYEPDGLVTLADDAPEFAERIEQALATDSPAAMGRRRRFAEQHTWTARFHQIDQAVRECVPRASIIIPTHNNLHLTRLCLEGIFRNTSWPNYEIVVVDNASSDETPAYLRDLETRVPTVRCLFNDRNEGYARANNQGLSMARGEYLVLLNNDTIVTRGWLSTMIRHLRAHADVGMIGPATNLAGNEAKINVDYANADELEAFAEAYTREHASDILEPAMLGFFCVVIPRQVLTEVGGLDERFGIGMFEDDDFSLRVRRAGYRLVCTDGAFVHHFHSATMRRFGEEEYLKLFEVNRKKFEEKWNIRWTPHRYRWQH